MKIYRYDKMTKEFLGEKDANIDPLETQKLDRLVYLMPVNATEIAPPKCDKNKVAVFTGKRWVKKDDFRGAVFYSEDGEKLAIQEIDKVLPPNVITTPPPENMLKPLWKKDRWRETFIAKSKTKSLTKKEAAELKAANTVAKLRKFLEKHFQA